MMVQQVFVTSPLLIENVQNTALIMLIIIC